jgi:hypothetical protein
MGNGATTARRRIANRPTRQAPGDSSSRCSQARARFHIATCRPRTPPAPRDPGRSMSARRCRSSWARCPRIPRLRRVPRRRHRLPGLRRSWSLRRGIRVTRIGARRTRSRKGSTRRSRRWRTMRACWVGNRTSGCTRSGLRSRQRRDSCVARKHGRRTREHTGSCRRCKWPRKPRRPSQDSRTIGCTAHRCCRPLHWTHPATRPPASRCRRVHPRRARCPERSCTRCRRPRQGHPRSK